MKFIPKGPASKPQMQAKSQQNSEDDAKKKKQTTHSQALSVSAVPKGLA
jgi:hypothetical protein